MSRRSVLIISFNLTPAASVDEGILELNVASVGRFQLVLLFFCCCFFLPPPLNGLWKSAKWNQTEGLIRRSRFRCCGSNENQVTSSAVRQRWADLPACAAAEERRGGKERRGEGRGGGEEWGEERRGEEWSVERGRRGREEKRGGEERQPSAPAPSFVLIMAAQPLTGDTGA